eukprot:m.72683 g.72683  ORF g.72683 m.72683 type:complete len:123 (+) comp12346_c0_seq2:206-574(+)
MWRLYLSSSRLTAICGSIRNPAVAFTKGRLLSGEFKHVEYSGATDEVKDKLTQIFKSTDQATATCFHTLRESQQEYERLVNMYYKGEISVKESARRTGFILPESGEYPEEGLLQKSKNAKSS